jgi:hypothetical protein
MKKQDSDKEIIKMEMIRLFNEALKRALLIHSDIAIYSCFDRNSEQAD